LTAVRASEVGHLPEKDVWAFEALKELLAREKGFDLEAYKERCVLRRIYLKVRSKGYGDLGSYYRKLRRDPDELGQLIQYLTINVTEFFRNPTAFEYLERKILPDLMVQHSTQEDFGIWSAGCSSGEEPYSLAIILLRIRKRLKIRATFHVLATDLDKTVLERGREGIYTKEALKNLNEDDLSEFFFQTGDGYRVNDDVRKHVTFRVGDILKDRPAGRQSIIVCRNLLIYFSRENQERVITGFSRALHRGGYMMLGKAETLVGKSRLFFQSISPTERIYRLRDMPLADGSSETAF
jgi:chemotaxis protein methyltransferase CheR